MGVARLYLRIFSTDLDKILRDEYYAGKCLYNFPLDEMNFYDERYTEEEIEKLRETYEEYFYEDDHYFMTEYWDALHFLLADKDGLLANKEGLLLNYCVFGKHPICKGEIKYLTSEEVKEIATSLNNMDINVLMRRYDCNEFNQQRIYFKHPNWQSEDVVPIIEAFQAIAQFYTKASLESNAMLIGIL